MSVKHHIKHFKRKLLSSAISCLLPCATLYANPGDPTVVDGSAAFATEGHTLTVTNSNGAVIDWRSFSIDHGETTHFEQPSAHSSVLNQVTGPDQSQLLGTLSSNGQVFLINPNGILVGEGAKIDVAGFVASNLNINTDNFKAGTLKFEAGVNSHDKVQNLGTITTPNGGSVYLVGTQVDNQGVIHSPQGQIILAAGQTVEIRDTATPGVSVAVTGSANQSTNLGQLVAHSGQIGVVGAVVKNSGLINANQIVQDENGRIFLKATKDLSIETGSQISANAPADADPSQSGGQINLQSEQGNIEIQAGAAISANGPQGGQIQIAAEQGNTRIGGDLQAIGSSGAGGSIVSSAANQTIAHTASLDVSGHTAGGHISLTSSAGPLKLEPGAQLKAQGQQGGRIDLSANRDAIHQAALLQAQGTQLNGGQISLQAVQIDNQGQLDTQGQQGGGQINLSAQQIRQSGQLNADGQSDGGQISLNGQSAVTQLAGGLISAQGYHGQGGTVSVSSAVTPRGNPNPLPGAPDPTQTLISGYILVNGRRGGSISITGDRVGLTGNADLEADGLSDGGNIKIGGGAHGQDPSIANAQAAYIAASAKISANGGRQGTGNGGQIVVWSDQSTRVYGTLSAAGGPQGGNGGFIETSGHWLDTTGIRVDASAAHGQAGVWLLDPYSLTVVSSSNLYTPAPTSIDTGSNTDIWTASCDCSVVLTSSIQNLLNSGTNVQLDAGNAITVSSAISTNYAGAVSLTLNAGSSIQINANISDTVGSLNLNFNLTDGSATIGSNINVNLNGGTLAYNNGLTLNGTLQNATLDYTGNAAPALISSTGTLQDVTLGTSLTISPQYYNAYYSYTSSSLHVAGNLTLANGATLNIGLNTLTFNSSGSILTAGSAGLTMGYHDAVYNQYVGGRLNSNGILTLGSGIAFDAYGTFAGSGAIINQGAVTLNNGTLIINTPDFTNSGTFSENNGSLSFNPANFTNSGTFSESNGTLDLTGSFSLADLNALGLSSNRTGGNIDISGTLNLLNTDTLDIGSSSAQFGLGGLSLLQGTIEGNYGTLVSNDISPVLSGSGGTLGNMTIGNSFALGGNLDVNGDLVLANGVTFDIGANSLTFTSSGSLTTLPSATGTLTMNDGSLAFTDNTSNETLTIGSGITIFGHGSLSITQADSNLVNNGTIEVSGGSLNVSLYNNDTLTNSNLIQVDSNGTLTTSSNYPYYYINSNNNIINANTGTILVEGGSISADLHYGDGLTNNGLIQIDNSGSLGLSNNYYISSFVNTNTGTLQVNNGTLDIDLTSSGSFTNNGLAALVSGELGINRNGSQMSWSNSGQLTQTGGTLYLGGSFSSSDLAQGHFSRSGAGSKVFLPGVLDNSGSTLNIGGPSDSQAGIVGFGTLGLDDFSGTISGGVLISDDGNGGNPELNSDGGTLEDVTIGTDFFLANSTTLNIAGDLTLETNTVFTLDTNTLYFSGSSSIVTAGTLVTLYLGDSTLSLNGDLTIDKVTLTNSGTLDGSGGFYFANSASNAGTLTIVNGDITIDTPNWSGTLYENSGTLNLGGSFSLTDLNSDHLNLNGNRSGGDLDITGTLTIDAGSLDIGQNSQQLGTGGLTLLEGTINGGTLFSSDSTLLNSNGGTLSGVLIGDTTYHYLGLSGSLNINGNLALKNAATLDILDGALSFVSGGSISSSGTASLTMEGGSLNPNGTLTIASSVAFGGYGTLVDNGTFIDQNALTITSGILDLNPAHWQGVLQEQGGTINLIGSFSLSDINTLGFASNRSGGELNITGTLNNSGSQFDLDGSYLGTGGLTHLRGTINSGTLVGSVNHTLNSSGGGGILTGVTIGSDLNLAAGSNLNINGNLTLLNGISLDIGANSLTFNTAGTIGTPSGSATLDMNGGTLANNASSGTLTIGSGITVFGYGALKINQYNSGLVNNGTIEANGGVLDLSLYYYDTLRNNGRIQIDSGSSFNVSNSYYYNNFNNYGTIEVNGGTLGFTLSNVGTLSNIGLIQIDNAGSLGITNNYYSDTFNNSGTLLVNSGTLSINSTYSSTFTNSGSVTLVSGLLDIGGSNSNTAWSNSSGQLAISGGTLNLGGSFSSSVLAQGHFTRTGGSLYITGSMNNSGATLDIGGNSQTGVYGVGTLGLDGLTGSITGGTLISSNSVPLLSNGGTLSGVTIGSNLTIGNGAAGTLNVYGNLGISTGAVLTNSSGSTINLTSGILKVLPAQNVRNWSNQGTLLLNSGGTLALDGTFHDSDLASLGTVNHYNYFNYYTYGTLAIASSGTLINDGGSPLNIGSGGSFGGSPLNLLQGTIQGGVLYSGDGTTLTGSGGTLNGVSLGYGSYLDLSDSGNLTFNNVSLNGGTLDNNASLTITGGMELGAGTLNTGNTVILASGVLNITPGLNWINTGEGSLHETGGTLNLGGNSGTFTHTDLDNLNLSRSGGDLNITGTLDNSGTLSSFCPIDIGNNGAFGAGGLTSLSGTILGGSLYSSDATPLLNGGGGTLNGVTLGFGSYLTLNETGSLNILGGITLADGASLNTGASSLLTFAGNQTVSSIGNAVLNLNGGLFGAGSGNLTIDQSVSVNLNGGTLGENGNYSVNGDLNILGDSKLNSGTLSLTGLNLANGVTLDTGASTLAFIKTGNQSITSSGAATVTMEGSTIYPEKASATLTIGAGVTVSGYGHLSYATNLQGSIVNNGTLLAATPGQLLWVFPTTFLNNGLLQINSGTLSIGDSSTSWSNHGSMLQSGGILNLGGNFAPSDFGTYTGSGGTLQLTGHMTGTGTMDIGGNTLVNAGEISTSSGEPSGGTLSILGNYQQSSSGILQFAINSATPGNYDLISIAGNAQLAGGLSLSGAAASGAYPLLEAMAVSGEFSSYEFTDQSGRLLLIEYDTALVTFNVQTVSLTPNADLQSVVTGGNVSGGAANPDGNGSGIVFPQFQAGSGFFDPIPTTSGVTSTDGLGSVGGGDGEFGSGNNNHSLNPSAHPNANTKKHTICR